MIEFHVYIYLYIYIDIDIYSNSNQTNAWEPWDYQNTIESKQCGEPQCLMSAALTLWTSSHTPPLLLLWYDLVFLWQSSHMRSSCNNNSRTQRIDDHSPAVRCLWFEAPLHSGGFTDEACPDRACDAITTLLVQRVGYLFRNDSFFIIFLMHLIKCFYNFNFTQVITQNTSIW